MKNQNSSTAGTKKVNNKKQAESAKQPTDKKEKKSLNANFLSYQKRYKHDGLHDGSVELYHHGRLHQKWGVKNGPPYPLSRSETANYAKKQKQKIDISKVDKNVKNATTINNEAKNIKRIVSKYKKDNKNIQKDLSDMSDADLQKIVKRLNMERQYNQLTGKDTDAGKDYVGKTLDIIGDALGVASSAIAIALGIKALKSK
jgi:hypothetical protein